MLSSSSAPVCCSVLRVLSFVCVQVLRVFCQGGVCEPPADYSGACGSMSFKGLGQSQLEDAVLKCRLVPSVDCVVPFVSVAVLTAAVCVVG